MFDDPASERVRTDIQTSIPGFEITTIEFLGEGMDSKAYLVNEVFLFRFLKYDAVRKPSQVERCILPQLQSHISANIPNFWYVGTQCENGLPFVGYPKVEGRAVDEHLLAHLNSRVKHRLLHDIATFLREMHSVPVELAYRCRGERRRTQKHYETEMAKMREHIYPRLSHTAVNYVENLFDTFVFDLRNLAYAPGLVHGDISGKHLLIDELSGALNGVIDFGDLHVGDPDYDLIYFYKDYGEAFIRDLLIYYPHSDPERLLRKLEFFSRWNAVQDILLGLDRTDEAIIEWAVRDLEREARL